MRRLSFLVVIFIAFSFNFKNKDIRQTKSTFTLIIKNVQNTEATIHIGFYKVDDKFPKQGEHAFVKQFVPDKTGEVKVSWEDIETGEYALAIYQDVDKNDKMKTNMVGYPKEPFAFTQNFVPKMSKPKFEQCKINFSETENTFEVTLL